MLRKTTYRHIERSEISQIAEEKRGFLPDNCRDSALEKTFYFLFCVTSVIRTSLKIQSDHQDFSLRLPCRRQVQNDAEIFRDVYLLKKYYQAI